MRASLDEYEKLYDAWYDAAASVDSNDVRDTYSGRGMYGKTTLSVTVDSDAQALQFAEYLASNMDGEVVGLEMDNMGLGKVVYLSNGRYWKDENEK